MHKDACITTSWRWVGSKSDASNKNLLLHYYWLTYLPGAGRCADATVSLEKVTRDTRAKVGSCKIKRTSDMDLNQKIALERRFSCILGLLLASSLRATYNIVLHHAKLGISWETIPYYRHCRLFYCLVNQRNRMMIVHWNARKLAPLEFTYRDDRLAACSLETGNKHNLN